MKTATRTRATIFIKFNVYSAWNNTFLADFYLKIEWYVRLYSKIHDNPQEPDPEFWSHVTVFRPHTPSLLVVFCQKKSKSFDTIQFNLSLPEPQLWQSVTFIPPGMHSFYIFFTKTTQCEILDKIQFITPYNRATILTKCNAYFSSNNLF